MKKLSLILILLILPSCTGTARQQKTLEVKKSPLVYVYDNVANKKAGSIAISSAYLDKVRTKISQNWNPPRGLKGKVRVVFSVNRLGRAVDIDLVDDHSSGSFYFKQAAIRAILSSNPFPPLPEEFLKDTLKFMVDLAAE